MIDPKAWMRLADECLEDCPDSIASHERAHEHATALVAGLPDTVFLGPRLGFVPNARELFRGAFLDHGAYGVGNRWLDARVSLAASIANSFERIKDAGMTQYQIRVYLAALMQQGNVHRDYKGQDAALSFLVKTILETANE